MIRFYRILLLTTLLFTSTALVSTAQTFTSGPITMCDTSYFTCNIFGVGVLVPPGVPWNSTLNSIGIDITSNHPQTLVISITSPAGTVLLLSAYNGAGGVNYTNCNFLYSGYPSITTGAAPFTGQWTAQGGPLSIFDGENADGTWTITVIDTACAAGGTGPGGLWVDGFFNGAAGGGFSIYFNPPPCMGWVPSNSVTICQGASYDILGYYMGIDPSLNYTISQGGFLVANPSAVTISGTYDISAWDFSGCNYWATFTLNVLPQTTLGADTIINKCHGIPINLRNLFTLTGITPIWNFNGTPLPLDSDTAAIMPGVYQLIGQNAGGCNDTVLVTLNDISTTFLGPDVVFNDCGGVGVYDFTPLYNTAGMPYGWYFNGAPLPNPAAVSGSGMYGLIAYDANNCTDTALVFINYASINFLGTDQSQSICTYDAVDLTSLFVTTGTIITWTYNGLPVVNPASVNAPGIYKLNAISSVGCTDSATVTISILPTPALGTDQIHAICANTTLDLTTQYNTIGYTSNWSFNAAPVLNPASVNSPGIYSLIVTAGNGCQDTAEINLSNLSIPSLGVDQTNNLCANTFLNLTSLYTTTGYTTAWTLNTIPVVNPNAVNSAGTYVLIATAANTCTDTADVVVSIQPIPALGNDQTLDNCANTSKDLTLLYNTTGATVNWTFNNTPVINPASVNTSGTYTLVATAPNGCSDTANILLSTIAIPSLGADQSPAVCANLTADLTSLYTTTGYSTNWYFNAAAVTNPSAVNTAGIYTLIAVSTNGCTDTATVNLAVLALPILGNDQTQIICSNGTIDLTTLYNTSGYVTNWTLNGTPVTIPSTINTAGIYQIMATNTSSCTSTANVTLQVNSSPNLGLDLTEILCSGTSIDLTSLFSLAGLTDNWTEGGNPVADPTNITSSGSFQLIATNTFGCSDTSITSINQVAGPNLGADQSYVLCQWMTVDLSALYNLTGLTSIYTFNGSSISNYTAVYDSGNYFINVTDANGCIDQAIVTIGNQFCLCLADFRYSANCVEDPITFELIADSAIVSAHWTFDNSPLPDLYDINPTIKLSNENVQMVTLEAELGCGTVIVEKSIQVKYCADSCSIYFPEAFTPNGDGKNDEFSWYTGCEPEQFQLEIHNRFGQVVYKSDNPNSFWDGKYNNDLAPVGVYVLYTKYKLPYQDTLENTKKLMLLR